MPRLRMHGWNCAQCIAKTGGPCHWVEEDLCSACVETGGKKKTTKGKKKTKQLAVGAHEDDTSEYTAYAADSTYPELDDVEE